MSIQRLADQTEGVGNLFQGGDTNLYLAIAPTADAGHVLGLAPGIVQFGKGHVEAEPQPLGLGDDVDEVGLGLVGDVELEHLLSDVGIERPDPGIQPIEDRPDLGVGQLGVISKGVGGRWGGTGCRVFGQLLVCDRG